jgi:hypothetical protein
MRASLVALVLVFGVGGIAPVRAEPVACEKTIAKNFAKLAKKTLVGLAKCLDRENTGTVAGPCPDPTTAAKLLLERDKAVVAVPGGCEVGDVAALGFVGGCNFGLPEEDSAVEAACRTLPATTPAEVGICLACWQQADAYEFMALLYASHAVALCDGPPDVFSTVCSAGGCSGAPSSSPDQRDLGPGGEYDCQRAIGKAAVKYLVTRRKVLQKCALGGGSRASCLADPRISLVLGKAKDKQADYIEKKCGNRDPVPNPLPGSATITWWDGCAPRACGAYPVTTLEDLHECTEDRADEIVDGMLCTQFPRNGQSDWPCPSSPSGAFLAE